MVGDITSLVVDLASLIEGQAKAGCLERVMLRRRAAYGRYFCFPCFCWGAILHAAEEALAQLIRVFAFQSAANQLANMLLLCTFVLGRRGTSCWSG